jgi:hypothetical protein
VLVAEALRSFFIRMDFVRDKKIPIYRTEYKIKSREEKQIFSGFTSLWLSPFI